MDVTYPEHDKREEVREDIQIIGDFLQWLDHNRIILGQFVKFPAECLPINKSFDDLIYEYFDIDRDKIEEECQTILNRLKSANS